jgi:hypothetical protein
MAFGEAVADLIYRRLDVLDFVEHLVLAQMEKAK